MIVRSYARASARSFCVFEMHRIHCYHSESFGQSGFPVSPESYGFCTGLRRMSRELACTFSGGDTPLAGIFAYGVFGFFRPFSSGGDPPFQALIRPFLVWRKLIVRNLEVCLDIRPFSSGGDPSFQALIRPFCPERSGHPFQEWPP